MRKKQKGKWQEDEEKMERMCDKFIEALKKLDGYSGWEEMLIQRIVHKLGEDCGLNGKINVDGIIDTLEDVFGFRVLKADSLAELIKIEQFIEDLKENPYELKLIA